MSSVSLFTSESVTQGHPDKLCDQVSDAIVDAALEQDPTARVAVECAAKTGFLLVFGEMTTASDYIDIAAIARKTIVDIGYDRAKYGFDGHTCGIMSAIEGQSPDIAMGVNRAADAVNNADLGAGDQGMMFGYATDETPERMPLPLMLSHKLCRELATAREEKRLDFLRPDGKAQVTCGYDADGNPTHIDAVVLSTQHDAEVSIEQLREGIMREIMVKSLPMNLLRPETRFFINPTGRFVIGGPQGDSGLTGRKIIVDTYGGFAHHGGGCFSGKDPTKVDRSGAYAARHAAVNIVAAGLARRCEVAVAYAIGMARPVQVTVQTYGTATVPEERIAAAVRQAFDLRPAAIIERFDLRRPIYRNLAAYGHFGRTDTESPWEKADCVESLLTFA